MSGTSGWIGVDLDGTLAKYDGWKGPDHIGEPIFRMVTRVRRWLHEGTEVRIVTARVWADPGDPMSALNAKHSRKLIQAWLIDVFGQALDVTCMKDYDMIELWDDRAIQVVMNTGERVG